MKKVRIFIASLALIAMVSGTLAFKARTFGLVDYYTINSLGTTCDQLVQATITTANVTPIKASRTPIAAAQCPSVKLTFEEPVR